MPLAAMRSDRRSPAAGSPPSAATTSFAKRSALPTMPSTAIAFSACASAALSSMPAPGTASIRILPTVKPALTLSAICTAAIEFWLAWK